MKWAYLFSSTIRARGARYYRDGNVQKVEKRGNRFEALVRGEHAYKVRIVTQGDMVKTVSCSCPYAVGGMKCKHMAAVFFAIENGEYQEVDGDAPFSEEEPVKEACIWEPEAPWEREPLFGYQYFDYRAMGRELQIRKPLLQEAAGLAEKGAVTLDDVRLGYTDTYYGKGGQGRGLLGIAYGTVRDGKSTGQVILFFDKSSVVEARCDVRWCSCHYMRRLRYGSQQLCRHELALFGLLAEYLRRVNPGDETDSAGAAFLAMTRMPGLGPLDAPQEAEEAVLDLLPRVHRDYYGLSVSFRIDCGKKFIVKDLEELVDQTERGVKAVFGKNTEVLLKESRFTDHGKKYLDFIRGVVLDEEARNDSMRSAERWSSYRETKIGGSIALYGSRLDALYALLVGDEAELLDEKGGEKRKGVLLVRRKEPRLRLQIQKQVGEKGTFQGIQVQGEVPELIWGLTFVYYMEKEGERDFLNQMDQAAVKGLEPLFAQETEGRVSFCIGRRRMAEFYYNSLPMLAERAEITEKDSREIRRYLPPKAAFVFYLDAEGEDVLCQGEAVYGEKRYPLMKEPSQGRTDEEAVSDAYRDWARESRAYDAVKAYFPVADEARGVCCCGGDAERVYRVLDEGVEALMALGEVQATDRFQSLKIRRKPRITVGVSVESELLDLSVTSEELTREELLEVLKSYRGRKKFHRLRNGDFLNLENQSLEELDQMMEALRISPSAFAKGKMEVPVYRALYLDKMLEAGRGVYFDRDRRFKQIIKAFKTVKDSDFEVPPSLKRVLRGYQEAGFKWLRTLDAYGFGGILADDMGLGKTLQAIAFLLSLKEEGREGASLVVTPASLVYNWGEEFARFAPGLRVCLIAGSQEERRQRIHDYKNWDVLVTSYDLLKRDGAEYEGISFASQILDEAQYIKNHATAAAKAVKIIRSRVRFALTGTPIENRLSELWSIFDYLMPGYLYAYEAFKKSLETPIVKNQDEAASARLRQMVSPFILRRLKEDVLTDLPDKLEEVRFARLSGEQQRLYDGQVVHMRQMLAEGNEEEFQKNKIRILAELTKIRQICCDPSLCFEEYEGGSAKREVCLELIKSAMEGEHKVLLFSQFVSMLELLAEDLRAQKIPFFTITGSTPKEERLALVKQFNQDSTPVFLISLKAGGTGLNLTGADVVIHYDPWWNLAVQNQATDRAHRIGQTRVVTVYKIIARHSIEEKILHMQETKRDLADQILEGAEGSIGSLSREELLALVDGKE